jgi:hypothetical protein
MKRLLATGILAASLVGASQADASSVVDCGPAYNTGGGSRNLTARGLSCSAAARMRTRVLYNMPLGCSDNLRKPPCQFLIRMGTYGSYLVKGRWIRGPYGTDQLDVRGTDGVRVFRFQTDWDNE